MSQPVVASYCTTFLKKEMRHIYRQVTGLKEFKTFVLTRCRENEDVYPFDDVEILLKPRTNFLRRFYGSTSGACLRSIIVASMIS